jgi:hypothetical protein
VLSSLTASVLQGTLTLGTVLLCTAVSLVLGLGVGLIYMIRNTYNKGFVVTLALLPVMVQIVIMMVNGNLGAGVAVAGAFSLTRFRSVPGSARDISSIFFSMAIGLATGMGYLFYALLFLIAIGLFSVVLHVSKFGEMKKNERMLRITIPETLDYDGVFDDIFEEYTQGVQLERIRTTNMGSLFELSYRIRLKSQAVPKEFFDRLRSRNGNLNIVLGRIESDREEL